MFWGSPYPSRLLARRIRGAELYRRDSDYVLRQGLMIMNHDTLRRYSTPYSPESRWKREALRAIVTSVVIVPG